MSCEESITRVALATIFQTFSKVTTGVLLLARDGSISLIDKSAATFLNYGTDTVSDTRLSQLIPTLSEEQWAQWWRDAAEAGSGELAFTLPSEAGEPISITLKAVFFDLDQDRMALGKLDSNRDQKEESLPTGEPENLNQMLLDRTADMICVYEEDGHFTYVNKAICRALGYTESEIKAEITIHDIDTQHTLTEWQHLHRVLKTQRNSQLESTFRRKDGTTFPIMATLIQLENGMTGMMAKDVSPLRQKESQLKVALEEIKNLSKQLEAEKNYLQEEIFYHSDDIITNSAAYQKILDQIRQVAPTTSTVLIQGESGTGKELLAHAIHQHSKRSKRTLVKVNCAALSRDIIESELFGHEKGAFTGAEDRRIGRFELANGGTIFLDEIGELPLDIQVKLLRVIQEGQFERVGSSDTLTVDVRIVAATNRNLQQMVKENTFRKDLYYRLNVFPIENLPLRKRKEDIPLLVKHFLRKHNIEQGKHIEKVKPEDLDRLLEYPFPGNVRELENIIERAAILSKGNILNLSFWKPDIINSENVSAASRIKTMQEMQRDLIIRALEATNWTVSGSSGAAKLLDMHPQTLHSRMRKLNIKLKK